MSARMNFDFNRYAAAFTPSDHGIRRVPRITCADGLSLSVQASEYNYCAPRYSGLDFYYEVEVGFPSARIDELMPYAESPDDPTGTVYGYVPVDIVNQVVNAHGGLKA